MSVAARTMVIWFVAANLDGVQKPPVGVGIHLTTKIIITLPTTFQSIAIQCPSVSYNKLHLFSQILYLITYIFCFRYLIILYIYLFLQNHHIQLLWYVIENVTHWLGLSTIVVAVKGMNHVVLEKDPVPMMMAVKEV